MKIISFSYWDKQRNWSFEKLKFQKLTLLVGASGVGKTQILKALKNMHRIAAGKSFNGIKWDITFEINDIKYSWEGEFESKANDDSLLIVNKEEYNILYEKVVCEKDIIVNRDAESIIFNGKKTVKLSPQQSVINLLRAEEQIFSIYYNGFEYIQELDTAQVTKEKIYLPKKLVKNMLANYKDIASIRTSLFDIISKMYFTFNNDIATFNIIKERYISIFPQIKDIRIGYFNAGQEYISIQIKEQGVSQWIDQEDISSGMLRSLLQISELYLCPTGSVLLMDEFENSLGVNCIDELTNDILDSKRDIQFILTSHHPYIINNIPYRNWKIVTRKAGKVMIKDASDYRIGESRHDAFLQLIQLEEYNGGIN